MVKKLLLIFLLALSGHSFVNSQINTDRVMIIGRNALYYEDYVLSIQYFNLIIKTKPYLAEPYFFRGLAKFYLDDTKGAEEDFSKAIELNPFFINAYQVRGDARLNLENFDGAINDYVKTLDYSPDNKYALINMGVANIQKKNYDEAEKMLNELVRLYPKYTQAYLMKGALFQEKGDTIQALENFDKAIESDKYYAQTYSMRGLLYYNMKDYDKSLSDLNEAIKLEPSVTGNYINRGLVRYSKNDFRGAMSDYDEVLDKEPNNIIARFNRGLLRAQVGDDNRAINDFDLVIQNEPENYIAYLNRAVLKQNIAEYRSALSDLNVVLAAHPQFFKGYFMRSDIKRKLNDLKGAEKDYYYALNEEDKVRRSALKNQTDKEDKEKDKTKKSGSTREESDKTIDKFNLLVVADAEKQEKSKYKNEARGRVQDKQVKIEPEPLFVITYYEKSSEFKNFVYYTPEIDEINRQNFLSRKLIITNSEVALTEEQVNIHFTSIDEYSKLLDENPLNAKLYFARSIDYMLVKNFANAIEDLEKAIALDPKFTLAYFNLAVVYTKQLEFNEYVPEYENTNNNLSALDKNNATPNITGSPLVKDKKTEDKAADFRRVVVAQNYNKVLELNPKFVYAYYNKAETRTMQKDYRAAILDYNEAIRKEPDFAEAYFNRGLNRLQLGEKAKGLDDLRKAGELGILNAYNIIKRMN